MKDVGQRSAEMAALKHAAPYVRLFKGKTFVLKAGGEALATEAAIRSLLEQVDILYQVGIRVVLVHGGGESSDLLRALGGEPRFVEGRRITDEKALEVAAMVLNGTVNTRVLAAGRAVGLPTVGLSGIDAGLVDARRRPHVVIGGGERVDYGFVGDVVSVAPGVLTTLLDAGMVPVVSPLSAAADGTVLNINADTVAAALAAGLRAEKLILLTGAPGILERPGDASTLVSYTDLAGLEQLREQGCLVEGMLPKASAIEAAIRGGVRRVHILSHALRDGLLAEVFTNEGVGTLVVEDLNALTAAEQFAGQAAGSRSEAAEARA